MRFCRRTDESGRAEGAEAGQGQEREPVVAAEGLDEEVARVEAGGDGDGGQAHHEADDGVDDMASGLGEEQLGVRDGVDVHAGSGRTAGSPSDRGGGGARGRAATRGLAAL